MGLIPWRNKEQVPVHKERAELWPPLAQIRMEMDRLFDRAMRDPWSLLSEGPFSNGGWMPSLDIREEENKFSLALEIPGVDPKDIEVTVSGNQLTIQGEKRQESETKEQGAYRSERYFGSFRRVVELPPECDHEAVNAEYKNGVLTITLQKKEQAQKKRIEVR